MNAASDPLVVLCLSQLVQVTVVALAVGLVVRLACRRRPHLAYALWMLVVVKSLTPPVWSSPTGVFSWMQAETTVVGADRSIGGFAGTPPEPFPLPQTPGGTGVSPVLPHATEGTGKMPVPHPSQALLAVWLLGVAVLGAVVLVRRVQCAWLLRGSAKPIDESLRNQIERLAERIGVRRRVRVVVSPEPIGPAVFGVLRPTVVLPARLLTEKPWPEVEPILAHELVHLRRRDTLAGGVQVLAQILWWFHPLIWWANREARRERERCCDQEVLARLGCGPSVYARALLHVLQWRRTLRPAFALSATDSRSFTSKRLEEIMSRTRRFHERTPWYCWTIALVAAVLILPGAAREKEPQDGDTVAMIEPRTIEESLAAFPKVVLEPGPVTIEGRCHDGEDNPLPGIDIVLLYRNHQRRVFGFVTKTKTDARGEFRFSGLEKATRNEEGYVVYYVAAWAPERASALTNWIPRHPRVLDFPMPRPATMTGRVIDPAGNPIQGAFVRFNSMLAEHSIVGLRSAKTDHNGRFAITDLYPLSAEDFVKSRPVSPVSRGLQGVPVFRFRVYHPEFEERPVRYKRMPDDIEVVLQPGAAITGRVLYEDTGLPAAGVPVSLQGAHDHDADLDNDPTDWAQTVTDGAGRYRFTSLRKGKYNVWADAPGWTAVALDSFELEVGQTREAPELRLIKGGLLVGRLVDNDSGERIHVDNEFVSVGIYGPSRPRSGAAIDGGRVDPDGTFRFRLPSGDHYVYLSATGPFHVYGGGELGARTVEIRAGEATEIEFRVSR